MPRHRFEPQSFHNVLGAFDPVARVADGDTVATETIDAWGFDNDIANVFNPTYSVACRLDKRALAALAR